MRKVLLSLVGLVLLSGQDCAYEDPYGGSYGYGDPVSDGGYLTDFGEDVCEANGWYGDGICDDCLYLDPDCVDGEVDWCEWNGWYGDGVCDDCPYLDPDCADDDIDWCQWNEWYGDGICDCDCPLADPDCFEDGYDLCEGEDWY